MDSHSLHDNLIKSFLTSNFGAGTRLLDIGPGNGKYGKMLNSHFSIDAVELDLYVIKSNSLASVYKSVFNQDIRDFLFYPNEYDIALISNFTKEVPTKDFLGLLKKCEEAGYSILAIVPYDYSDPEGMTEGLFLSKCPQFKKLSGNNCQGVFYKKVKRKYG